MMSLWIQGIKHKSGGLAGINFSNLSEDLENSSLILGFRLVVTSR